MRRAARIDPNHVEIVLALRAAGVSVQTLAREGNGVPDLLCGWRGANFLLEVKPPTGPKGGESRAKLNPRQRQWHAAWRGRVHVVRSVEDALEAIGARRKPAQEARS